MREISTHKTNECNEAITLRADERDELTGNASHRYSASVWIEESGVHVLMSFFKFQHGPIKTHGVNGITNEVLLAILIDRLEGFQAGKYKCLENAMALEHLRIALDCLKARTKGRVERGVEGTHEV